MQRNTHGFIDGNIHVANDGNQLIGSTAGQSPDIASLEGQPCGARPPGDLAPARRLPTVGYDADPDRQETR